MPSPAKESWARYSSSFLCRSKTLPSTANILTACCASSSNIPAWSRCATPVGTMLQPWPRSRKKMSASANIDQPLLGDLSRPPNTLPAPSVISACMAAITNTGLPIKVPLPTSATIATTISTTGRNWRAGKKKIVSVAERAQTTYVITNNHFESKAGVNALELKAMISGKRVFAPPTLIHKYPELRRIADPAEDSVGNPGQQVVRC